MDTVIYESEGGCSDYDENPFFKVDYFRITPLGSFVLDMEKEYHYDHQKSKSGFTFESDMQIKVMKESQNQMHKLFLSALHIKKIAHNIVCSGFHLQQ